MSEQATTSTQAPPAPPAHPADQQTPAPAGVAASEPRTYESVDDAVRELERRDSDRRAANKAAKQAKEQADTGDDGDDADAADEDPRRARKARDEDDGDDEVEARKRDDDDDADEDDSDDGEEVATDDGSDETEKATTVEFDGKTLEIPKGTPKALVEAAQKLAADLKADYTRKTQEAAQARQQAAQRAQSADQLLTQVQRAQQAVVAMAQQMIGNPPPLELAQTDPGSYMVQKALYDQRVAQLQQLRSQSDEVTQAKTQQEAAQQRAALEAEAREMVRVMPKLADHNNRRLFLQQAAESAAKSGFKPEDVAGVSDHRMLHLLGRVIFAEAKLDAIEKAQGTVKAKLANVPPKSLKPGPATNDSGRAAKGTRAKQEFLRSNRTLKDVRRWADSLG